MLAYIRYTPDSDISVSAGLNADRGARGCVVRRGAEDGGAGAEPAVAALRQRARGLRLRGPVTPAAARATWIVVCV